MERLTDDVQALVDRARAMPPEPEAVGARMWTGVESRIAAGEGAALARDHGLASAGKAGVWSKGIGLFVAGFGVAAAVALAVGGSSPDPSGTEASAGPAVVAPVPVPVPVSTAPVPPPSEAAPQAEPDVEPPTQEPPAESAPVAPPSAARVARKRAAAMGRRVPAAAPTDSTAGDLAQEQRILRAARGALAGGRHGEAGALVREHSRRFPRGVLTELRLALEVEVLCVSGERAEARRKRSAFAEKYPGSPVLVGIDERCGAPNSMDGSAAGEHQPGVTNRSADR